MSSFEASELFAPCEIESTQYFKQRSGCGTLDQRLFNRRFRSLCGLKSQGACNPVRFQAAFRVPIAAATGSTDAGHVRVVSARKAASPSQISTRLSVPHANPTLRGSQGAWGTSCEAPPTTASARRIHTYDFLKTNSIRNVIAFVGRSRLRPYRYTTFVGGFLRCLQVERKCYSQSSRMIAILRNRICIGGIIASSKF